MYGIWWGEPKANLQDSLGSTRFSLLKYDSPFNPHILYILPLFFWNLYSSILDKRKISFHLLFCKTIEHLVCKYENAMPRNMTVFRHGNNICETWFQILFIFFIKSNIFFFFETETSLFINKMKWDKCSKYKRIVQWAKITKGQRIRRHI